MKIIVNLVDVPFIFMFFVHTGGGRAFPDGTRCCLYSQSRCGYGCREPLAAWLQVTLKVKEHPILFASNMSLSLFEVKL